VNEDPASPTPYDLDKDDMYAYWVNMGEGKQSAQGGPQPVLIRERGGGGGFPMP